MSLIVDDCILIIRIQKKNKREREREGKHKITNAVNISRWGGVQLHKRCYEWKGCDCSEWKMESPLEFAGQIWKHLEMKMLALFFN